MRHEKGEATVEFAIIGVMLILVTFGIIEGGRLFGSWLIITNEAREASRWGALRVPDRATTADVTTHFRDRTQGVLDQTELTPTTTAGPDPTAPQWVKVQVTYNQRLVLPIPLMTQFLPDPIILSASSTMRAESAATGGG